MDSALQTDKDRRDYQLVLAARDKGDPKAYADLMHYYHKPVYLMLLRMTRNASDADILTAETFGKAFCQLQRYEPSNPFATWLFTIANNSGIDFIRSQRARAVSLSSLATFSQGSAEYPIPDQGHTPEESLIASQRVSLLRQLVGQLPPIYRNIIQLHYFDELSYEEIAQRTNQPMGTVKIQLHRARILLANSINQYRHCL